MIDDRIRGLIDAPLACAGQRLAAAGIGADAVTIAGCALGLAAAAAIAFGHFAVALGLLMANRLADGLDGAVARATHRTDCGGFLDITLDFLVYAAIPLGFATFNPQANALAAAFLLASFIANGCAFLAFAVMADRRGLKTGRGGKSIPFLAGLAEGFETIAFFAAFCLLPALFPVLAAAFAALCLVSAMGRLILGYRLLSGDG